MKKAAVKTTEALDPPSTTIFTPDTEFGSRFLVEVVRGCANLCRFCWAGYNYLPVRAFPTERILDLAQAARAHSSRAGLVSIALCDHPDIEHILRSLKDMGYSISPASLRLDDLTPTIVSLLKESGERSLTIAPETGSDRLRRVINKTITNEEILDRAELIFSSGIESLKLYYMIGLPTEEDADLVAIRDLTLQLHEIMLKHARAARPHRPDRRQRQPARAEARHRLPVAADGGGRRDRAPDEAAAHRSSPTSTTSTSTSRASGIRTTRRCCRSATAASRRRSSSPRPTAASGGKPWPTRTSTATSTSIAIAPTTPSCRGA